MAVGVNWLAERHILLLNHSLLMLCASIYLGTGVSLVLFQFPSFGELTVSNYYLYIVPPVDRATTFFTYMTLVMYVTGGVLLIAEVRSRLRWVPILVLAALTTSTLLTILVIFEYNTELRAGITDPARLRSVLGSWATLNIVRVSLWSVMWLSMMAYFALRAAAAIRDRA